MDPKTWIILFPLLLPLLFFFSSSYNFDLFIFLLELLSVFPGSCIVLFFLVWIYLFIIACVYALWPALISMGRADSLLDLAPRYVDGPGMIWCSLFFGTGTFNWIHVGLGAVNIMGSYAPVFCLSVCACVARFWETVFISCFQDPEADTETEVVFFSFFL